MSRAPRGEWPTGPFPWAVVVPLAVLAPFIALTALAFPQGDDVWFGWQLRDRGFAGMLGHFYQVLSGRLFTETVTVLPYLAEHWLGIGLFAAYRLFCGLVLLATIALAFWIAAAMVPAARPRLRLFLGAALACALIAGAPAPNDLFFSVSQIGNYTLAAMAALATMIGLHQRAGERLSPPAVAILAGVGFITAMATEMSGAILFIVVAAGFAQRWLTPGAPRQPVAHALVLAAIAAGALIVALAPANAVRLSAHGQAHHVVWNAVVAVPLALGRLFHHLYLRLVSPALVAWPLILAVATWHHDRRPGAPPVARKPAALVWLPLVTALVATYVALWIGQLGLGNILPPRARSHLHFVLVGGLTLTTIQATRAYGERAHDWWARHWPRVTARHLAGLSLALLILTPHTLGAMKTAVWDGRALAAAIDERFARLAAAAKAPGEGDVLLPRFPVRGWPVVIDELPVDPNHWKNIALARYYRVRSVRVEPPREERRPRQ